MEQGVEINGMVADKYVIEADNLVPEAEVVIQEVVKDGDSTYTNTTTLKLHGTGSLYLAQEGSFVIRVELADSANATEADFFFVPGSEMTSELLFDLIPTEESAGLIAPPAGCQEGSEPSEPGSGSGEEFVFPKMDDASVMTEDSEQLVYQTNHSVDEVTAFYTDQMAAAGWELTDQMSLGSIVDLMFTKGDQEVNVTIMEAGGTVTVTVILS